MFRISLGSASCDGFERRPRDERVLCEYLLVKLQWLRSLSPTQLEQLREEEFEDYLIDGKRALISVYREKIDAGLLLVVQGFLPTWKFPTYFSISRVGKVFVEGLLLNSDGHLVRATSDDLLRYR